MFNDLFNESGDEKEEKVIKIVKKDFESVRRSPRKPISI